MLDRALHVIDRNAIAQARLIDDMLDMARIVSGKLRLEMRPVDLVSATLAAIDVVDAGGAGEEHHDSTSSSARHAAADHGRRRSHSADRLERAVERRQVHAERRHHRRADRGRRPTRVELIVSDNGKGISPDFLPHVFERFRQANSSVSRTEGGLGLGLALVRQLVEMHGGQATVTSGGQGQGTTFTVTLPAVLTEEVSGLAPRPLAFDSRSLRGYRVLIVDDDADWRDLLETALRAHGAMVVSVTDGRQALEALTTDDPAFRPDVMVADIGLPQQDGYALIRQIRGLEGAPARMPAMAVTAYADGRSQRRALDAGFDTFRSKPIAPEAVAAAVIDLLKLRATPRRLKRRAAKPQP